MEGVSSFRQLGISALLIANGLSLQEAVDQHAADQSMRTAEAPYELARELVMYRDE